jgi:peptidoglycan/LPS O-acetylase OafA/YrhL
VLLYHLSLIARPHLDTGKGLDAWWWLTETPLKVFTAGTESVLVFFVLSGLVVALPAFRTGFDWVAFLSGRMLRLYLPVWAALAFAAVLIRMVPRTGADVTDGTWLTRANSATTPLTRLLSEGSLMRSSYDIDNVLWSLRWEIIFSLALPIFVGLAALVSKRWMVAAPVAVGMSVLGRVLDVEALVYLPVFFLGTLMAANIGGLRRWAQSRRRVVWPFVLTGSLTILVLGWLLRWAVPAGTTGSAVLWGLAAVGAVGVVVSALGWTSLEALLSARVPHWLGRVSFGLYLVHVPIIATLAFLAGDDRWWVVAAIGIPLSLLIAWGFTSAVEKPTHRLARLVGRSVGARVRTLLGIKQLSG